MDLAMIILLEVRSERESQLPYITDMWNLKYDTTEFIYKTETDSRMRRADCWLPRGEGTGEGRPESLGSAGANCYIQNGETARSYSGAQGTIFSIL